MVTAVRAFALLDRESKGLPPKANMVFFWEPQLKMQFENKSLLTRPFFSFIKALTKALYKALYEKALYECSY